MQACSWGWTGWSAWSSCSRSCGEGGRRRTRACLASDWTACRGPGREEAKCNLRVPLSLPISAASMHSEVCLGKGCPGWSDWGEWGGCSASCGYGSRYVALNSGIEAECGMGSVRRRERECSAGGACPGLSSEAVQCEAGPCPRWGAWEPWAPCSVSCGQGSQRRNRSCSATLASFGFSSTASKPPHHFAQY